ncbi:ImmA/IrrE family metallo-endopeptidase [Lapidilactobacillus mulanensis]|uniref:ImmA/IrrE family metallo-endopeptidase n=1 Tax=Lapidilactobacillus mulanensis TaxID=2485999 RepID=A0ABW4DRK6_9LACO|nr:ImmA/IrrE family metallo-endopeptidase [Lapidilactobacillus mulanensis]
MALYETLDEFLIDTDKLSGQDPETICESLGIDICYTDKLPDAYLGLSDPIQKAIFINEKVSEPFSNFLVAHELTHNVLGDVPAAYLDSSYVTYLKVENEANSGAISLLIRYYMNSTGIEIRDFNIINFLDNFEIPYTYYFMVQDVVEKVEE